jgi:hypothetical protein
VSAAVEPYAPCSESDDRTPSGEIARRGTSVANGLVMQKRRHLDELVEQLSERSVTKHFDAYADVDWDAHPIERDDPRFELGQESTLGATEWYQNQPQAVRAELGLTMVVRQMKVGVAFENVLSRGLLHFATSQPNGSPAFRYAYHEVIEESQHSLMFQEFINRSGLDPNGLEGLAAFGSNFVPFLGKRFPELFFLFVLGGEGPIDHEQRRILRSERELHPLLERIIRIHVLEEARHICFATELLKDRVPDLSWFGLWNLRIRLPFILGEMSRQMLEPPRRVIARFRIPDAVVREAYTESSRHRGNLLDSLASIRALAADLRIVVPSTVFLWERLGIWPDPPRLLGAGA